MEYFPFLVNTSIVDTNIQNDYTPIAHSDKWIFFKNLDHFGDDICRIKNINDMNFLKLIAENIEGCVAFNTYGWIKKTVDFNKLIVIPSSSSNIEDGLYVKLNIKN